MLLKLIPGICANAWCEFTQNFYHSCEEVLTIDVAIVVYEQFEGCSGILGDSVEYLEDEEFVVITAVFAGKDE